MTIEELIKQGKSIERGLTYVHSPEGVVRLYDVYRPANADEYYRWKEYSIRFLQLYSPTDLERFVKYSEEFEKHHYIPRFISNMVGVLDACAALPSEKMKQEKEAQNRDSEISMVESLEQAYMGQTSEGTIHKSITAFHDWHAAACVLFDKWFYPTEDDWVKFQSIEGDGNGYVLKHEFDMIYSPYKKLMARLKDGRNLKGTSISAHNTLPVKKTGINGKVNIFISYSHEDEKWLELLKKHLKVLAKYSGKIEYWVDTKLRGGDKWREEITKAIDAANVAILLVSTNFLASDFITSDELPPILRKAEEGGTRILPLIASPCEFIDSELGVFQAVNDPDRTLADLGNDEAAIARVFLELNKNIKDLL